jgi:hypothetical protein
MKSTYNDEVSSLLYLPLSQGRCSVASMQTKRCVGGTHCYLSLKFFSVVFLRLLQNNIGPKK